MTKVQNPFVNGKIKVDSLKLVLRIGDIKNHTQLNREYFKRFEDTGEIIEEPMKDMNPKGPIFIDGIRYGISFWKRHNVQTLESEEFVSIALTGKLLKGTYPEGITLNNYREIYELLQKAPLKNRIEFSWEAFQYGIAEDIDLCKDYGWGRKEFAEFIRSADMNMPRRNIRMSGYKNSKYNQGIWWGTRKSQARLTRPMLKFYNKMLFIEMRVRNEAKEKMRAMQRHKETGKDLEETETFYTQYFDKFAEPTVRKEVNFRNTDHWLKLVINENTKLENLPSTIKPKTLIELLELVEELNNKPEYSINFDKLVGTLYMENMEIKKEMKKTLGGKQFAFNRWVEIMMKEKEGTTGWISEEINRYLYETGIPVNDMRVYRLQEELKQAAMEYLTDPVRVKERIEFETDQRAQTNAMLTGRWEDYYRWKKYKEEREAEAQKKGESPKNAEKGDL